MNNPPKIFPVEKGIERPLWSVMIPAYNRCDLLAETLRSVLAQDPGEHIMQIEVVDDGSSDMQIENIVNEVGCGRIKYYRQERNVGSVKNFELCLSRAKGYLVHLLHSDDIALEGYYKKMQDLLSLYPEAGAAICRYRFIDANGKVLINSDEEMPVEGILQNWLEELAVKQRIQYCSITVRRRVYEHLGGFYGANYGEDWEMWLRIACNYPVIYTPNILAAYRMHFDSISGASYMDAKNLRDLQRVILISQNYLPVNKRNKIYSKALKECAYNGLRISNYIWHNIHDKKAVKLQVKESLKMHTDFFLLCETAKVYLKMILNYR